MFKAIEMFPINQNHHVESLENSLKISENINYVKLFISYFRTNEANAPMGV